jgi:hypothetical protein
MCWPGIESCRWLADKQAMVKKRMERECEATAQEVPVPAFEPASASLSLSFSVFGDLERFRWIAGLDITCGGDEVADGGETAP